MSCEILTVGHSTHPIEEFIAMLRAHGVTMLVDVRTVPRSRTNPQFNRETLPQSLAAAGIGYVHEAGLGGFRRTLAASPNTGWRNLSFRGYADYMQTREFERELDSLIELSKGERIALMCAEAVPWRCHRSLIADALVARGISTCELTSAKRLDEHKLTQFACVEGTKLSYPPPAQDADAGAGSGAGAGTPADQKPRPRARAKPASS